MRFYVGYGRTKWSWFCNSKTVKKNYKSNYGKNSQKLKNALEYLLSEIEKNTNNDFITQVHGTQIQSK